MPTRADGEVIRRLRERRGLTTRELAHLLGYNAAFIWKLENDVQGGSPASRLKIADFFGVPVENITRFVPLKQRTKPTADVQQAA